MAVLISGLGCEDPATLYQSLGGAADADRWFGRANVFRVPLGRGCGRGHVLLRKGALDALALTADHTLTFSGTDRDHVIPLQKITVLNRECISPGHVSDSDAVYLCECVDRRHHLKRVPIDQGYNVRAADGTDYLTGTKNGGSPWTWQEVVTDLSDTALGIGALSLPFTPDGAPENLAYYAPWNAWDALCDVLDRIACAVEYDPVADTFAVVRLGSADTTWAAAEAALDGERLWDGYAEEEVRGWRPEKVLVLFPRRPQPTDGTAGPYYAETVTLAAADGVEAGTYVQLIDDLTALGATGAPSNAADCATRAAERAADWLRKRGGFERPLVRAYRDFVTGSPARLLGSLVGAVEYRDDGGHMRTVVRAGADGALEGWRPLTPGWLYIPEDGGVTGSGTDNRVVRWDGTDAIQDSGVTLDDLDALSGISQLDASGDIVTTYGGGAPNGVAALNNHGVFGVSLSNGSGLVLSRDGMTFSVHTDGGSFTDGSPSAALTALANGGGGAPLLVYASAIYVGYDSGGTTSDLAVTGTLLPGATCRNGFVTSLGSGSYLTAADIGVTVQAWDADLDAIAALATTAAGRSVLTITDPNADRLVAWDDSAGAVVPIALADVATEAAPAGGDYLIVYLADGSLAKVDWDDLPSGSGISDGDTLATGLTFPNTGLHLLDTDASHDLILKPGSNLTADRTLTLTTGDADRTLDISAGSVTVSAFGATLTDDADAATARTTLGLGTAATQNTGTSGANVPLLNGNNTWSGTNAFSSAITVINSSGLKIRDTDASHTLGVVGGSNLTADRTLTLTTGDASRTLTLTGDTSLTGTNTGDQTITLTGNVTGSGTGSFATTIASDAVTNAMLANMAQDTIKGRASGAGTGDPTDLTATQATAILNAFVAAGGSAAKGLVPSPGSTAYTNHPYLLGSQSAFVFPAGKLIASKLVATDQSTTSTTKTDLATTDDVTFTLDAAQGVLVVFLSNAYNSTAGFNVSNTCLFNGTEDTAFVNDTVVPAANSGTASLCYGTKILSSGSNTVKVQHYVPNGGTGHWRARLLLVFLVV